MYIFINGKFILQNEAKISPFDHGFLYGLGVFETFRIYGGHPFLLDDHFQRLQRSLEDLNIYLKMNRSEVQSIIFKLLSLNDLKNAYIRFNVSAGEAPVGLQTEPYLAPNIIVFIKPINEPLTAKKQATILKTIRNTPEGGERLKSHHYLNNILGKRELPSSEHEGIFLTSNGYVAEGIVSNVFWVKDGQVYTPAVSTGILNGITRKFVIELLKKNNIHCHEGFFSIKSLLSADEMFITNSIQEVVAITHVNTVEFKQENKVTRLLQNLYKQYLRKRILSINEINGRE